MLLQAGIRKITYMRNYHNDPYAQKLIALKHVALNQVTVDPELLTHLSFEQPKHD